MRLCFVARLASQALLPEACFRSPLLCQFIRLNQLAFRCLKRLPCRLESSGIKITVMMADA